MPFIDIGFSEDTNKPSRRVMEDSHCHKFDGNNLLMSIFDGHAGKQTAAFCGENFVATFEQEIDRSCVASSLCNAFASIDQKVKSLNSNSGCTAVAAYIDSENDKLYCANVGDARAVLCSGGEVIRLTYDHKGSDFNELKRVQESGGFIFKGRVNGTFLMKGFWQ